MEQLAAPRTAVLAKAPRVLEARPTVSQSIPTVLLVQLRVALPPKTRRKIPSSSLSSHA